MMRGEAAGQQTALAEHHLFEVLRRRHHREHQVTIGEIDWTADDLRALVGQMGALDAVRLYTVTSYPASRSRVTS